MKKNLLFLFAIATTGYFLFSSSSNGRAASANQGNTGAPGDNSRTCVNCHNSGNIDVSLDIDVLDLDGDVISEYTPGDKYQVRVRINNIGNVPPSAYGFQMVCLDAPLDVDGDDIANWIDTSSNDYKISNARGRQYVEHDGPSGNNEFYVDWTAPESTSGQVSFYAAGNGVNLNGGTSGDGAAVNTMELPERVTTSVQDFNIDYTLSPIPATDQITLRFEQSFSGLVTILSASGQVVGQTQLRDATSWNLSLNDHGLNSGLYIMRLQDEEGRGSQRSFVVAQ